MPRYIFITGGVVSSLGKGLGAAALAAVLTGQYPAGATTVVAVASGGNIDAPMFQRALDEGPIF